MSSTEKVLHGVNVAVAIVLAGGVGSRLYPLSKVTPKPLIPFAGAPLIEYLVDSLLKSGFFEVIITAKYLGDQIVKYFKGRPRVKPLLLNSRDTADAVRLVADMIKGDFLVSMGDVATDIPFSVFFEFHLSKSPTASIVLKQVDNPLPYGLVYVDEGGYVYHFAEKPRSIEACLLLLAHHKSRGAHLYSNLVNAGIYAFKEEVLSLLVEKPSLMDFGRHVFPYLLEQGHKVLGWIAPAGSYWNDIGVPSVYKEAVWDLLEGRISNWSPRGRLYSRGLYIAEGATVKGSVIPPVYIGKDVVIEEGAVVGPYASLEEGTIVKKEARVSYAITWQSTTIAEGSQVHDSIVMNNATVGPQVKVVSSIVGTGCTIGRDLVREVIEPCSWVSPYEAIG